MANPDPSNKFKPGQSGNPGGRPKLPRDLREKLKQNSANAFEYLAAVVMGNEPKARVADRIRAAEILIERTYGKSAQPICGDDGNKIVVKLTGTLAEWGR